MIEVAKLKTRFSIKVDKVFEDDFYYKINYSLTDNNNGGFVEKSILLTKRDCDK